MANINGNNIDDLFRQASDHYPLRTDSADWAKLSDALEKDPSLTQSPVNEQENGHRRRKFFLLFFLLPLAGAGYFFWHSTSLKNIPIAKEQPLPYVTAPSDKGSDAKVGPAGAAQEKTDAVSTPRNTAGNTAGNTERTTPNKTGAGTTTLRQHIGSADQHTATLQQNTAKPHQYAASPQQYRATPQQHDDRITAGTGAGTATVAALRPSSGSGNDLMGAAKSTHSAPNANNADNAMDIGSMAVRGKGKSNPSRDENNGAGIDPQLSAMDVERALANQTYSLDITRDPGFAAPNSGAISKDALIGTPADKIEANSKAAANTKKDKTPVKLGQPRHQIYVGLLGAPDLSTVKLQNIKGVGTTFGVLFGYSLNPKWGLETGLYLDRKKYYTDGQYFNKASVPPLQYVNLLKVDGICNMLEIPINIRYNLNPVAKNKWFATAGLSTYLMSSEQYAYQAVYNGMPWDKSATYRTPSQNWFSIVNLSIGYEQKLGRMTNLRLEPYLRVPLSGIGTGSLPIMSAGLNLGITRKIR